MQAVALSKLNMQSDAMDMLNEASQLEEKRQERLWSKDASAQSPLRLKGLC
jgi:hypothetical protein